MRAVIFNMPDIVLHFVDNQWKIPGGGGPLIAANNPQHEIFQADLLTQRKRVVKAIQSVIREIRPRAIGLSAMSFQYYSACRTAEIIRAIDPSIRIGLGGYHATVNYETVAASPENSLFDFIVRNEGEATFGECLDRLEENKSLEGVLGLSFRLGKEWVHNPRRPNLDLDQLKPPKRSVRLWKDFRYYGRQLDVFESTRGCVLPCNFCSIAQMYGRTFRKYPLDFVMASLEDAKRNKAGFGFLTDDNVTLDPKRFMALCQAMIENKHNDLVYLVQASANGIAKYPELAEMMAAAGFKFVFLGIENVSSRHLKSMGADRKSGGHLEHVLKAIALLKKNKICIIGGMILGLPDDRPEDIEENFRWYSDHKLAISDQVITPYPKTGQRKELQEAGYVKINDFRRYDGFWANVQTDWMSPWEIEYWRWYNYRRYVTFGNVPPEWKSVSQIAYYIVQYLRKPWQRLKFILQNPVKNFDRYQRKRSRANHLFDENCPDMFTPYSLGGRKGMLNTTPSLQLPRSIAE